jgi:hypothetical protein
VNDEHDNSITDKDMSERFCDYWFQAPSVFNVIERLEIAYRFREAPSAIRTVRNQNPGRTRSSKPDRYPRRSG